MRSSRRQSASDIASHPARRRRKGRRGARDAEHREALRRRGRRDASLGAAARGPGAVRTSGKGACPTSWLPGCSTTGIDGSTSISASLIDATCRAATCATTRKTRRRLQPCPASLCCAALKVACCGGFGMAVVCVAADEQEARAQRVDLVDGEPQHRELLAPLLVVVQHAHLWVGQLDKVVVIRPRALLPEREPAVLPLDCHQESIVVRRLRRAQPEQQHVVIVSCSLSAG
eukprot:5850452-Prymnesium_polylepis.2